MHKFYDIHKNGILLHLKISPNSKENKVLGIFEDGFFASLKISITSPPEKGKANKELINYLSQLLKINKSSIIIQKGNTSHKKLVKIEGDYILLKDKIEKIVNE